MSKKKTNNILTIAKAILIVVLALGILMLLLSLFSKINETKDKYTRPQWLCGHANVEDGEIIFENGQLIHFVKQKCEDCGKSLDSKIVPHSSLRIKDGIIIRNGRPCDGCGYEVQTDDILTYCECARPDEGGVKHSIKDYYDETRTYTRGICIKCGHEITK